MINVNSVVKQNTGFSLQIECLAGMSELVSQCIITKTNMLVVYLIKVDEYVSLISGSR